MKTLILNKVSFIMPSFRGGGAERVFLDLAEGFSRKGYVVDLVVISNVGSYKNSIYSGINVVNINKSSAIKSVLKLRRYLLNSESSTVISCLTHLNIVVILASILANFKGNIVVTEHNNYFFEKKELSNLKSFYLKTFARILYKFSDYVVAVSQGVAESLRDSLRININDIKVIYNPIDVNRIMALANSDPMLHFDFDIEKILPERYLLGMGRLVKQKRYDIMIKAFYKVKKFDPEIKLVILGDGPMKSNLQQLIKEKNLDDSVIFFGFVDNPFFILNKAKMLVLSSDFEGFGNVIAESLVLGRPVVSTNCPSGPDEILSKGKFGVLVPVSDIDSLANGIISILRDNNYDQSKLIERGKEFDKGVAIQEYEKLLLTNVSN